MRKIMKLAYSEFVAGHTSTADLENCPTDLGQFICQQCLKDCVGTDVWAKIPVDILKKFFSIEINSRRFIRSYGRTTFSGLQGMIAYR